MTDSIIFEALPRPGVRRNPDHATSAAALRDRPGEWGRVGVYSSSDSASAAAYGIRMGRGAYAPAGAFDARGRTIDGEHRVYAQYVGESTPEPEAQG